MQPQLLPATESAPEIHNSRKSVSDLIAAWTPGVVFDADRVLAENPELRDDHSVVLDLAYEEYCQRTERGEEIDLSDFVSQFSTVESSLLDMIEVHQVLYDHPSTLTNGDSPRWPEVGDSHLDLKLLEQIGNGSFSQVYIASESGVGERRVVAKLCSNANHEASLLGRLEHPNIVPILSVKIDRQKNLSAICMPFMGRTTLAHAIKHLEARNLRSGTTQNLVEMLSHQEHEECSDRDQAAGFSKHAHLQDALIDIAIQLCRGLEFAHSRGVIHGDLKPSNILLTKHGSALLMDFNLSQRLQPDSRAIGGTLAYMAPEQLAILAEDHQLGKPPVICNEQTDIYSLGVLLLELFTGSHPVFPRSEARIPAESARRLLEQLPTRIISPRTLDPSIESTLAQIIKKTLALDPQQRWATVGELRAALESLFSFKIRMLRSLRRNRKIAAGVCLGLSIFLASGALFAALPTESERLFDNAQLAMAEGRPADAIHDLEALSIRSDTPPEAAAMLGLAYTELGTRALNEGQFAEALAQLRKARKLDATSSETASLLAQAYLDSGAAALAESRNQKAIADLTEGRKLAPDSPEFFQPLCIALIADQQLDTARDMIVEWKSRDETDPKPVALLAFCYYRQAEITHQRDDYLSSIALFKKALDLPGNVSRTAILNNIGLCHRNPKLNQLKTALEPLQSAYQSSSELDSQSDRIVPYVLYISVQKSLAIRERHLPDLDRIEDCLLSAPNSAEIFVVAAESYAWASFIGQNDPDQLDRYLRQSLELYTRAAQEGLTSDDLQFIEQLRELSPKLEQRLHELPEWERLCSMARSHREKEYPSSLLNPLL